MNKEHRGITLWHNVALVTFASVAIGMTWTVMNTGFSSSEVMKDTIEKAVISSENSLMVVGKMTGTGLAKLNQVTLTATPVTTSANGVVVTSQDNIEVTYQIVKDGSYTITQEDIYVGALYGKTYNSVSEAVAAAKESGLIRTNPLVDAEKPDQTTAFFYWIIDLDGDANLQKGEVASLVIVYADKDRPATGEHLKLIVEERQGVLLDIERNVPNISASILDFGGKVEGSRLSGD